MPRTRNPRRPRRMRYRRKRKYNQPSVGTLSRAMPGFPKNKVVSMRYVDQINLDPGVGSLSYYQYRANSIYDPDNGVGGHQPLGRDQWYNFYNQYTVIGAKIKAQYLYSGVNANKGQAIGIYLSDDTTVPTTATEIMEQGRGSYKAMAAVVYGPARDTAATITQTYSPKKFFNITNVSDNQSVIGADMDANPTRDAIFTIWNAALDTAANLDVTEVLVTIDYLVMLSEPKSLVQS